jgi:glycine/D-amino acid oxidase-like deaminating enzyme/nitrite reductase/ring-hydroxylating ferredoxin subunit
MRSTRPLWQRPLQPPSFPPLSADLHVEVAVVGGGITGLTTALLLAEAGKRVALLEARQLGAGVTGHTTAHLTEAIDTRYHELESKLGRDAARLVRASSRAAIEKIAELAGNVDCGFQRLSGYLYTDKQSQLSELDAELLAAERAGASVERSEVPLPLTISGGLAFRDQAQFLPLSYLSALAARLSQTNAVIYEGVSVLDVETKGQLRLLTDRDHSVVADAVVLATHAPFAKLTLQLELAQYRSYVIAGRSATPPAGLFWDMQDPYHYIRSATVNGESYLIVGGADHRTGTVPDGGAEAPYQELDALGAQLGIQADARWSAQVVESADGLPFIGQLNPDERVFVAQGFAGNGMTFGTLSAMLLCDSLLGRDNPYAELYRPSRFKPQAALGSVVTENLETAGHLVSGHLKPVSHEPISELAIGQGRIIKSGGEKLAVYRDQDGAVHALSAICTHQGCQVAFNAMERSWDCPCHGSRFDIDGRVLDGPAKRPLETKAI